MYECSIDVFWDYKGSVVNCEGRTEISVGNCELKLVK